MSKGYKKTRVSAPGERHRQPNGPTALNVQPVDPPSPAQLGTAHLYTTEILVGGSRAIIAAQREAARLSAKFGEEIEAKWCLATPWLIELTTSNRERARYALMWRPRFLAVVALTHSIIFGCRAAKVNKNTVALHRSQDPEFDGQVLMAQSHAIDLLHDVTMKEAIEGRCEPVFWQGIPIGHVVKTDNRLRVELLRAHLPRQFKTPGHGPGLSVNIGAGAGGTFNGPTVIVDAGVRDELVALRQEALLAIAAGREAKLLTAGEVTEIPPVSPDSLDRDP